MSIDVCSDASASIDAQPNKSFWIKEIQDMQILILPFCTPRAVDADSSIKKKCIDDPIIKKLLDCYQDSAQAEQIILALLLAYFLRLNHGEPFSAVFSHPKLRAFPQTLFANWVPLTCYHAVTLDFASFLASVCVQYEALIEAQACPQDLLLKHANVQHQDLSMSITIATEAQIKPEGNSSIHWVIDRQDKALILYFPDHDVQEITKLCDYFYHFVAAILRSPATSIAKLSLLPDEDYKKLIYDWNQTEITFFKKNTLQQLFEYQVAHCPDKIALTDGEYSLTYNELNQRINQLARYIKRKVADKTRIGIYLARHVNVIISLFAVLKSGNTYVPISSAAPALVIQDLIMDSETTLLLTQELLANHLKKQLPDLKLAMVCVDTDWHLVTLESISNLPQTNFSAEPVCIIYTSGSTGKPKGVQIKHQSLVNVLLSVQSQIDFTAADKILGLTPITFDISAFDIYMPLITGASLVFMNDAARLDPQQIIAYLNHYEISIMQATPVTCQMLLDLGWRNESGIKILSTGEGLDTKLAERLRMIGPLWNLYGPSETTIWSTIYRVQRTDPRKRYVAIGKPIANTKVYVLDHYLQPVPLGMPGVLHIAGEGLALGYLNHLELTQEKFVNNPFETNPKYALIYNTGDLVRQLEDGHLEYIRRVDNQVKIRGLRIELGEIEHCLMQNHSISQAVVVARDGQLIAYIVLQKKESCDKEVIVNYLKQRLYPHLIPSYFMVLPCFPLTPNGKINKQALPLPQIARLKKKETSPKTKTQRLLTAIWSEVLAIPAKHIGMNTLFFNLGGHSLSAMHIVARVRSIFLVDLSIADLYHYPSIESLANKIDALPKTEVPFEAQAIDENTRYPLSHNQMRLWFLNELYANSAAYNMCSAWTIYDVDVMSLSRAVSTLIERHLVFRTVFVAQEGKPAQVIKDLCDLASNPRGLTAGIREVEVVSDRESLAFQLNIETLSPNLTQADIKDYLKQLATKPFDLQKKLFHFRLLQRSHKQSILFICIPHLIFDYWSFGILYQELSLLYAAYSANQTIKLPQLPIQYLDYCTWQQRLPKSFYMPQIEYWKQQLAHLSSLELPLDYPRPARQTFSGQSTSITIPKSIVMDLKKWAQDNQLTLFACSLSAYALLLATYSQQTDFAIGIPIANRNRVSLEKLIGFFVNTLAIRFHHFTDQSVLSFCKSTQSTLIDAQAHAEVPFEMVVDALQLERDQSKNPVFQTMFGFYNTHSIELKLPGVRSEPLEIPSSYARFELSIFLREQLDVIEGTVEYNTDLFTPNTIAHFIKHYLALLAEIVRDKTQSIHHLSFLLPQEKQRMSDWNKTQRDYPLQKNLIELIEQQVANHPDKQALYCEDQALSYAALNAKANQLAHFIRAKRPEDGQFIVVYLERNSSLVVCLLAILKSNNTFVPITQETPKHLIGQILDDCKASMILTNQTLAPNLNSLVTHADIFELENIAETVASYSTHLNSPSSKNHLTYVLYTSGTTGQPKGVAIKQRSLINLLLAMQEKVLLTEQEVLLAVSQVTFDIAMLELFGSLIAGATLVLASQAQRLDPRLMMQCMDLHHITMMQATPATWQMLVNTQWQNERGIKMLCGGEALSSELASKLLATGATLWNLYGPTETTIWSTAVLVCPEHLKKPIIAIGKPLANTQVYVLDNHLQLLPIGVPGELYIGGEGVCVGYLNQTQLTQERFIPDPFSQSTGSKLYRTGDLVVWSQQGELHYLGRIDTQIKMRGHRIEVEAIENLLKKTYDLIDCAVCDRNAKGEQALSAYMVVKNETFSLQQIQSELKNILPDYMIPSKYFIVDVIPLSPHGKVDRKKLSTLTKFKILAPSSGTIQNNQEKMIIDQIKTLLKLDEIDPESNFFDLGVHSLLLLELSCALSKAFAKPIHIIDFFTYPCVRSLAQFLMAPPSDPIKKEIAFRQKATSQRQRKIFKRRI